MNHFIENVGLLLRVTIGAKAMTGVLTLMRLLHPPSFPFFQPFPLFSLALFEVGVLFLLANGNVSDRFKLKSIYCLGWLFAAIHSIFIFAKETRCPCLGALSGYDNVGGTAARWGVQAMIVYMIIGATYHLCNDSSGQCSSLRSAIMARFRFRRTR
jgi:hypothetical protein